MPFTALSGNKQDLPFSDLPFSNIAVTFYPTDVAKYVIYMFLTEPPIVIVV